MLMLKPLRYSQQCIEEDDIAAVVRVLRSDWLTCGPETEAFEAELAAYVGAKHCVVVSSGTAALYLAYLTTRIMFRESGLYSKSNFLQMLTSPLSFVATANAALGNWEVAFHDVDSATGNLACRDDPPYDLIVPVHFAGRAAKIPNKAAVIEDACHALGAMDFDGCSRVGSCAHSLASVFSFHAVKPITTGEGGAITTNDADLAKQLYLLRSHGRAAAIRPDGSKLTELMVSLGYNYRMTEIQAALGRSQLQRCDEMRERRYLLTVAYWDRLSRLGMDAIVLPPRDATSAWHLYPIRLPVLRNDVKAKLNEQGIMAQVHYSPPIHLQPWYRERFGYKEGDFPEAEAWAAEELSLPLHARMTEADVDRVCKALKEALV